MKDQRRFRAHRSAVAPIVAAVVVIVAGGGVVAEILLPDRVETTYSFMDPRLADKPTPAPSVSGIDDPPPDATPNPPTQLSPEPTDTVDAGTTGAGRNSTDSWSRDGKDDDRPGANRANDGDDDGDDNGGTTAD